MGRYGKITTRMSLYSIGFLAFLFSVFFLYYVSPHRFRWAILLLGSVAFYLTYSRVSAVIIGAVILVNYLLGLRIEHTQADKRNILLWVGILFDIGLLLLYKFFGGQLGSLPLFRNDPLLLQFTLIPVGLSFHTLQAVSYLVEVSRGNQPAERHAGVFALTILFFPRVLAGPIERPATIKQFKEEVTFDYAGVTEGIKTMAWGFFKKMVIADRLLPIVNIVYLSPIEFSGASLLFAVIAFAFAIYADFSGYSDIAVGAARMFGIKLTQNFTHPYLARSISEFWQRWHISLSNWLRDYIFFPVRRFLLRKWGSKAPILAMIIPPIITMLASGLWHGTGWTFIVWGLLHGIYLVLFQLTEGFWQRVSRLLRLDHYPKLVTFIQQVVTFILVSLALIIFQVSTLEDAYYIFTHLLDGVPSFLVSAGQEMFTALASLDRSTIYHTLVSVTAPLTQDNDFDGLLRLMAFFIIIILEWTQFDLMRLSTKPVVLRWAVYTVFIAITLLFAVSSMLNKEFIYFRF